MRACVWFFETLKKANRLKEINKESAFLLVFLIFIVFLINLINNNNNVLSQKIHLILLDSNLINFLTKETRNMCFMIGEEVNITMRLNLDEFGRLRIFSQISKMLLRIDCNSKTRDANSNLLVFIWFSLCLFKDLRITIWDLQWKCVRN